MLKIGKLPSLRKSKSTSKTVEPSKPINTTPVATSTPLTNPSILVSTDLTSFTQTKPPLLTTASNSKSLVLKDENASPISRFNRSLSSPQPLQKRTVSFRPQIVQTKTWSFTNSPKSYQYFKANEFYKRIPKRSDPVKSLNYLDLLAKDVVLTYERKQSELVALTKRNPKSMAPYDQERHSGKITETNRKIAELELVSEKLRAYGHRHYPDQVQP